MPPSSAGRSPFPARQVVALGSAQIVAWASSTYLPAIVATPVAAELGLPRGAVFGAFSFALLAAALAGPAVGRAIDRRGGRAVLCASNLMLAGGLVLLAAASHAAIVYAAFLLLGLGMAAGLYDAAFAALVRVHGRDARAAITAITLLGGFASTVGWTVTAWATDAAGWRAACAGWALAHLLLALPLNRLALPAGTVPVPASGPPEPAAPEPATAPADPAPGEPDRRRGFAALLVFSGCTAFVTSAMAAHLPGVLHAAGVGAAAAVAAAALFGPAQVAARATEFLIARGLAVHPLVTARVATVLHPLGALLLALSGGTPAGAAALAMLHGAGNGMITIARGVLPLALFGAAGYGRLTGLLAVAPRIAQAAAPWTYGLVLDAGGVRAALWLSAGLSLAGFIALAGLRRR